MKNTILFSLFLLSFVPVWAQDEGDCGVFLYGEILIPDDQSECTSVSIQIDGALPGETLNSLDDLQFIWVDMEHSMMEDLVIMIECPNGTDITLHNQGGGGTSLGQPNESDGEIPGVTWDYWWSDNALLETFAEEAEEISLPSGIYSSVEPLSGLTGCPVNGQWTLVFCDMWPADNGYLFGWGLGLDESLLLGDCQQNLIPGCTDETACNYNPIATSDDGSCLPSGCTDWNACNYDQNAECDDGSCNYPGCASEWACNFNPLAGCSDGSCVFPGCTDPDAENYDPNAGCDDGSCIFIQYGCTDEFACNFDPNAEEDDASCEYTSCVEIEIIWTDVEYLCDTTILSFYVVDIEPNYAVPYLYSSMEQNDLIFSLSEGVTYNVSFSAIENGSSVENFPLFVQMGFLSGENFFEIPEWSSLEIDMSIVEPEVIQIDNNMYYCTNCEEQDADIFVWIMTDQEGNQYTFEDSETLFVPEDFEGTLEVCLVNALAGCSGCSQVIEISTPVEEIERETTLTIFSNGYSSPSVTSSKKQRIQIFESGGKVVLERILFPGEVLETGFAGGMYFVVGERETHKFVISP